MRNRRSRLLMALVLLAVGAWTVGWYAPRMLRTARATADWVVVQGSLISSQVVERSQPRRAGSTHRYAVSLSYEYRLDDAIYRGTRYSIAGDLAFAGREEAERNARAFRSGDELTIHFDPEDPTQAVLEPGGERQGWATLVFGVLLLGAGALLAARRPRASD